MPSLRSLWRQQRTQPAAADRTFGFGTRIGADIVAPFREPDRYPLADWYRVAKEAGLSVRMVFASAEDEQAPLRRLLLAHVDDRVLGPDFEDSDIASEQDCDHFDLLHPDLIERHLDVVIGGIENTALLRTTAR